MTIPSASNVDHDVASVWGLDPGWDADAEPVAASLDVEPATVPVASAYPVAELAGASVGAATLAATVFGRRDRSMETGPVTVSTDHALAAWRGYVELDGSPIPAWAELSGQYLAGDGRYVQLHCNFPHHAAGVAERLGVDEDRAQVGSAIAEWDAFELEEVLRADGMICAAYRSLDEWSQHPHAVACGQLPLVDFEVLGDDGPPRQADALPERPLHGLRVLDCSRVLAGPVCGRTLAAHGADVLRVGAAHLPSVEGGVLATGFGKRNTFIDLDTAEGREVFTDLLRSADVFVDAYRPGALASRGFSAEQAAVINPGIVVIEICAFDWVGPWADRRGFDSIVQSTTGIAQSQARLVDADKPVHLPVQALDFATGYLAAFAACRLLAAQRTDGGSRRARLSLLRTRNWLVGRTGPQPFTEGPPPDVHDYLQTVDTSFGALTSVKPVAGRWDSPPTALGSSRAAWLDAGRGEEHGRG